MNHEAEALLGQLGADRRAHSGRTLHAHLHGTAALLRDWGCRAAVCDAGLFHSIYGTDAFATASLDIAERARLRAVVGDEAERLAFLFGACERPAGLLGAAGDLRLRDRRDGTSHAISRDELRDLLAIECANLVEQGARDGLVALLARLPSAQRDALLGDAVSAALPALFHCPAESGIRAMSAPAPVARPINAFDATGYAVLRELMSEELMDVAFRYYTSYVGVPGYYRIEDAERALDRPADALSEVLLAKAQPQIEQLVGRRLSPTYSFARIYTTDSRLNRHVDRGACEISATLTIGYRNVAGPWPIQLHADGEDRAIPLGIGDALVYRGMELPHWRDPLPQGIWCQVFLHYVDADGPLRAMRFDGRRGLGPLPLPTAD